MGRQSTYSLLPIPAMSSGKGLMPIPVAALIAIGAIRMAVAVLLMNMVSREVVK